MDFSGSFSSINERLKPRITSSQQLYSSLTRLETRSTSHRPTILPGDLSLRNRTYYRPTILSTEPQQSRFYEVLTHRSDEPDNNREQENLTCDCLEKGTCSGLTTTDNSCIINELNLKDISAEEEDVEELADGDSSSIKSEEKDNPGELASQAKRDDTLSASSEGEGGSPSQRNYIDGTLPDLLKNGRPLSRRRTLGHVSETLNEVRREVELSRRRSIKLKAQVDKLQENREGPGWSQHRERVTDEVLSILRLLHPLTDPGSDPPEPSHSENRLDSALAQLQNMARKLAISHTKQDFKPGKGKGEEDSAILQQALRDRDEAIEKKKAMEEELLRSKTEMMLLNNQLLEAVQKRLELSLELEAWKEDVQLIIQQQIQLQHQVEQTPKKTSRLGILKRNRPPVQRPTSFPLAASSSSTPSPTYQASTLPRSAVSPLQTSGPSPTGTQRNWMNKLRRGKNSRPGEEAAGQETDWGRNDDGFQVVSLD